MANASILSAISDVKDPEILKRFLYRMLEELDTLKRNRDVQESAITLTELATLLQQLQQQLDDLKSQVAEVESGDILVFNSRFGVLTDIEDAATDPNN